MKIFTIKHRCRCGYKFETVIPFSKHFEGGKKSAIVKHTSCMMCCKAVYPGFEDIETALASMMFGWSSLKWPHRKWLMENTPLPWVDSDEDAIELASALEDMKRW